MIEVTTFEDARKHGVGRIGLVPTMGFLHEGHLSLVEASANECDTTVVSVFVNPLQFGEATDLESYPRDLARDAELAYRAGADVIVAPTVEYMYPSGTVTSVTVERVTDAMEGAFRPGHFTGVATVVTKLFAGLRPDRAYFGRKDAQQLAVVSTMARDLSFPVEVVGKPIIREADGLALSSRNVRLSPDSRRSALTLSGGLMAASDEYERGCRSVEELKHIAMAPAERDGGVSLEYVELADAATALPMTDLAGTQFLAIAARVDGVRLIDNITIDGARGAIDRGRRLTAPSILYGGP